MVLLYWHYASKVTGYRCAVIKLHSGPSVIRYGPQFHNGGRSRGMGAVVVCKDDCVWTALKKKENGRGL